MGNDLSLSLPLREAVMETWQEDKQTILLLNRRGNSRALVCVDCRKSPECPRCNARMTYHSANERLMCHYCGYSQRVSDRCPKCNGPMKRVGTGTQKVQQELESVFPGMQILRMDADTVTGGHEAILKEFEEKKIPILLGTQMVAKGHDFPLITFVGILDADLSLYFSDYKATEKTFQLVTQVAGRAGRADKAGHVVLQTYYPKHYVYNFAKVYDYNNFYLKEINLRETTKFPPFSTLVRVLITSTNDDIALGITHEMFLKLKDLKMEDRDNFVFLEAMRAPVTKVMGKHRYQIVMRILDKNILDKIYTVVDSMYNNNVQIFVEINPNNFS